MRRSGNASTAYVTVAHWEIIMKKLSSALLLALLAMTALPLSGCFVRARPARVIVR
jgi:hypothetical protein